jgi:hypothetical protein
MKSIAAITLLLLAPLASAEERIKSFYSSTDPKFIATIESSEFEAEPEIDHFTAICPGYGGYELIFEGGDARSWINVRRGGQTSDLMGEILSKSRGMFPNVANQVVEWRGVVKDGEFRPYAIIFRMLATDPEDDKTEHTTLVVVALKEGRSEVIGTAHGAGEDAKAKQIADDWRAKNP